MAVVRWNPVQQLAGMEIDRLNRMFDGLWLDQGPGAWVPPVDIFENDSHDVVIRAELPEMKREDIRVTVENGVLTLSGERRDESEENRARYHRKERFHGSFCRSFTLPGRLDAGRITAAYENGVLTISLPVREETRPKQIAVEGK